MEDYELLLHLESRGSEGEEKKHLPFSVAAKRTRVLTHRQCTYACQPCQKAKKRCENDKPCVRCVKRGLRCVVIFPNGHKRTFDGSSDPEEGEENEENSEDSDGEQKPQKRERRKKEPAARPSPPQTLPKPFRSRTSPIGDGDNEEEKTSPPKFNSLQTQNLISPSDHRARSPISPSTLVDPTFPFPSTFPPFSRSLHKDPKSFGFQPHSLKAPIKVSSPPTSQSPSPSISNFPSLPNSDSRSFSFGPGIKISAPPRFAEPGKSDQKPLAEPKQKSPKGSFFVENLSANH